MPKIKVYKELAGRPCQVAVDRAELSPEDFTSIYGSSPSEFPHCSPISHADANLHPELTVENGKYKYAPPIFDETANNPRAMGFVNNGRSLIPTCAAHAQGIKSDFIKGRIILQGLRKILNPGESRNVQRMFNKWSKDRREKAIKKRNVNQRVRSFNTQKMQEQQSSGANDNTDNSLVAYDDINPAPQSEFKPIDLIKQFGGVESLYEDNEENESDMGDVNTHYDNGDDVFDLDEEW